MKKLLLKLFLTFFGTGLIPKAPGTFGSIAGAICALPILMFLSDTTLFLACILVFLIGISAINLYEEQTKTHDASHIVIDEVAGVWLAMSISGNTIIQAILSLLLFRVFDILKPSIIGRVDKNVKGGLGVMGDDMLAGFIAGIISAVIYHILLKSGLPLDNIMQIDIKK